MGFMTESEARQAIVAVGKRISERGYVASNDGNISVKIADDLIVVTPTGVSKGCMTEDMLVVMNLDGVIIKQGELRPSSEVKMHLRVYQEDPAVMAVVHAHPVYATSFSIAGIALDQPILTEAMLQIGAVPVAHYAKPGTTDVPDSIAPYVKDGAAVLLSNHGALTWGTSLEQAFSRMEVLETYAHVSATVMALGKARPLSTDQVEELSQLRSEMGLSPVGMPQGGENVVNADDVLPEINEPKHKQLLEKGLVRVHQTYTGREEALRDMARLFVEQGYSKATYPQAIVDRERVYPTGLPAEAFDIAISHCDSEHVIKSAIGVTVLDEPVEFEMMGGMSDTPLNVRVLFMLAIKDPKAQVPTLQKMMAVIQNKELLLHIRDAQTAEEVYELLAPALAE